MARQVIVTGTASRVSREETVGYFRTRPHGSQLGAWASDQSTVFGSRAELISRYELAARYPEGEKAPAPPNWGGFRVVPETIEFWQGTGTGCTTGCGMSGRKVPGKVERLCP
ncbi:Pyridoxine/pyridoxamine 5'-phosphate oxidase OS=Streptomyces microflavus OX=1919 GN=pdxH PE=3 SV=1 [Streptomyces microflavus]